MERLLRCRKPRGNIRHAKEEVENFHKQYPNKPKPTCRAKLENVVVVGSNKCVWVQLDSECCEFISPKDRDPGSYNGE